MEREQRRWDQERAAWRAREAALLQELAETRKALVALALAAAASNGGGGATGAAAAAAAAAATTTAASSAAPAPASSPNAPAWAELFDQVGGGGGEPSVTSKPAAEAAEASAADDDDDADEEARVSSSIAAAMSAAMAAVQEMDVLSSETDVFLASALSGGGRGSSSSAPSLAAPAAAETTNTTASAATAPPPVETPRGDPQGPPPVLSAGDDDIYWMDRLHTALAAAGFYPPDEEVESWLFGPGTTTALLTFQACGSLPETGCADEPTWRALLGDEEVDRRIEAEGGGGAAAAEAPAAPAPAAPVAPLSSSPPAAAREPTWPIVAEMDGGRAVHRLQLALSAAGFHCGEDEMQWWQFGGTTLESLRTFQACGGLPETGVTCARTWRALLGPDARPEDLERPVEKDEGTYDEDLTLAAGEGRVWLLGEQRWARPLPSKGGDAA
jgi:hypothetical protein